MLFSRYLPVALLASLTRAASSANPDDPTGTTLYVTEPACGSFRCVVEWNQGQQVIVNWINPSDGYVSVQLASNLAGGKTYMIASNIPAISQAGYCDAGRGLGVVVPGVNCGAVEFVVPGGWAPADNYTIAVQSLSDSSLAGYTDAITIVSGNSSFGTPPSGTTVSLITIPAPTSTDLADSVKATQSTPSPTAVVGGAAASSTSGAASRGTSSNGSGLSTVTAGAAAGTTAAAQQTVASTSTSASTTSSQTGAASDSGASIAMLSVVVIGVIGIFLQ